MNFFFVFFQTNDGMPNMKIDAFLTNDSLVLTMGVHADQH